MKLSISPYRLKPRSFLNSRVPAGERSGVLLKVEGEFGAGYSDLFPWPELGDEPLEAQLRGLREHQPPALARRSLALAVLDGRARAQGVSWGEGLRLENNALIPDPARAREEDLREMRARGFATFKVKMGRDLSPELRLLEALGEMGAVKVRLDFNGGPASRFRDFMKEMPSRLDALVEYIEDPCALNETDGALWSSAGSRWRIAIDHEIGQWRSLEKKPPADVFILKPALQDPEEWVPRARAWGCGLAVTSRMDHPVGLVHGALCAADLVRKGSALEVAGCLTLACYEPDAFSEAVPVRGPFLEFPRGTGIGFDELLEGRPWTLL